MKRILSKVYIAVFEFLGSHPRKYWLYFILTVVTLFLATIIFSVYLFVSLGIRKTAPEAEIGEVSGPKINLKGLNSAVGYLEEKEKKLNEAVGLPQVNDPSL